MLKKRFDWTSQDIAYWEKLRQKGLSNFIVMYGVVASGGFLFILIGVVRLVNWLRQVGSFRSITLDQIIDLALQLAFATLVGITAGVINSLITWVVEERIYRKFKARQSR